ARRASLTAGPALGMPFPHPLLEGAGHLRRTGASPGDGRRSGTGGPSPALDRRAVRARRRVPLPAGRPGGGRVGCRCHHGVRPGEYLVLALALLVGSGLQGSIGFGAGLVAAPVIALVRPDLLPSLVVCSALVITSVVTIRERSELDLRGAGWALAGRIPGSAIGAWMVVAISTTALSWVVALSVLLGIGSAFLGWRPAPSRPLLIGAGALSGIMGTSTSIGGAPSAIGWQGQEPARLRGTMS